MPRFKSYSNRVTKFLNLIANRMPLRFHSVHFIQWKQWLTPSTYHMDHLQKILISKTLDTIWTLNSWNKSNKTHQTNEQTKNNGNTITTMLQLWLGNVQTKMQMPKWIRNVTASRACCYQRERTAFCHQQIIYSNCMTLVKHVDSELK